MHLMSLPNPNTGFGSDTYVHVDAPYEVEEDALELDEDARYLTLRFDRKLELTRKHLNDPHINRLNDNSVEIISFVSKGNLDKL